MLLFLLLSLVLIHFRKSSRNVHLLVQGFTSLTGSFDSFVAVFNFLLLVLEPSWPTGSVGIVLVIDEHHLPLNILGSICASLLLNTGIARVRSEQTVRLLALLDIFILHTEGGGGQIIRILNPRAD